MSEVRNEILGDCGYHKVACNPRQAGQCNHPSARSRTYCRGMGGATKLGGHGHDFKSSSGQFHFFLVVSLADATSSRQRTVGSPRALLLLEFKPFKLRCGRRSHYTTGVKQPEASLTVLLRHKCPVVLGLFIFYSYIIMLQQMRFRGPTLQLRAKF